MLFLSRFRASSKNVSCVTLRIVAGDKPVPPTNAIVYARGGNVTVHSRSGDVVVHAREGNVTVHEV